jgi:hypothetical protein
LDFNEEEGDRSELGELLKYRLIGWVSFTKMAVKNLDIKLPFRISSRYISTLLIDQLNLIPMMMPNDNRPPNFDISKIMFKGEEILCP